MDMNKLVVGDKIAVLEKYLGASKYKIETVDNVDDTKIYFSAYYYDKVQGKLFGYMNHEAHEFADVNSEKVEITNRAYNLNQEFEALTGINNNRIMDIAYWDDVFKAKNELAKVESAIDSLHEYL